MASSVEDWRSPHESSTTSMGRGGFLEALPVEFFVPTEKLARAKRAVHCLPQAQSPDQGHFRLLSRSGRPRPGPREARDGIL